MKSKFSVVIKQDEGWWVGWVQEIPGVNSQGKTRAELMKNLRSALKEDKGFVDYLDSVRSGGIDVGKWQQAFVYDGTG